MRLWDKQTGAENVWRWCFIVLGKNSQELGRGGGCHPPPPLLYVGGLSRFLDCNAVKV